MKRLLILGVFAAGLISACSPKTGKMIEQNQEAVFEQKAVEASINLTDINEDRLLVQMDPGMFREDTVLFRLPRVVQGTYSISNFGTFAEGFKAYSYDGLEMEVTKTDSNTWVIPDAPALDRIEYYVNDTFDIEGSGKATPFSPAGTNISDDVFVLNLHGFVGYFEGKEDIPYEVAVTSPDGMAYSSAMREVSADTADGEVTIVYAGDRYFDVTDNPLMYGDLTQERFEAGGIEIVFSVYSPSGNHTASQYRDVVYEMMQAQSEYIGDLETTDRYDIFLYLSTQQQDATGFGALEHQTSTVMTYPDAVNESMLNEGLVDVVAHEFFHILTPLSVHSEDVHYFDYNDPTFSRHLWMYEGLTEYFASHFQVYEGLQDRDAFYEKIVGKIQTASALNDTMSFTEMSENVIDEPYASNYYNVYMKGALINMCLDIILREQSDNEMSMIRLIRQLSQKYGKDNPFEDDAILDEITAMTYPEVGEFFETHVVGNTPIDYLVYFDKVGLELEEAEVPVTIFFRDQQTPFINVNQQTGQFYFMEGTMNSTLRELGVQGGDVIKSVNGTALTMQSAQSIIAPSFQWSPDTDLTMVLIRDGDEIEVSGKVGTPTAMSPSLVEMENATEQQIELRNAWLGGN
ncbi:peptidase M61 [Balneola sp. MJW-20]|uniref:M61 family metallopeptidase n=1 Tax=Gracilimonas aurantiaca TaxID=3234185 RepID=UPI0034672676